MDEQAPSTRFVETPTCFFRHFLIDPSSPLPLSSQNAILAGGMLPSCSNDQKLKTPATIQRVNVLGVGVSAINLSLARDFLAGAIRDKTRGYICVTGVHGVMECQDDDTLRKIHNRALLCTPDGMPMVWCGKLSGHREMTRVYGPDLMLEICQLPGVRHFLYGGANGAAQELQQQLRNKFPKLQIVGTYEPPWRALNEQEEAKLTQQVQQAKPDIIWVGLSTPKQERFMAQYLPKLDVTLMIGVGAAFDLLSGRVAQAPRWIQRSGLEWLYRLCREPKRLWRRYFRNNPRFAFAILCQAIGLRRYSLD
jgi:N-acetylglucosaminyldiphosphoundecaprenol N-acetyl-beta-D-mannosaminyltransferase